MALQFSEDGKYFAQISCDGKLKVWNTLSNSLDQEFTPDFHLTTPCTCLQFWYFRQGNNKFCLLELTFRLLYTWQLIIISALTNNCEGYEVEDSPSPKKKKRKEEPQSPHIVLGTTSGIVLIYSIAKANIDYTINSNTHSHINCLSIGNRNLLYSGADQNILEWNLKKKELKSHWKAGNETITSILAIPEGQHILTGSKNIKLWDVHSREVLRTFVGHSSDIVVMHYVNLPDVGMYLLTGSKADRLLSCWNLSKESKQKTAVCNYLMEDVVQSVSINISLDGLTSVAATNRTGTVHVYQHKLNGKCDKPIKPKTSIQVVSDSGQNNATPVAPIRIFGARFLDSATVCIGHGSEVVLTFENVAITSKRLEVLIRVDPHASKRAKDAQVTKLKKPLMGDDVHYLPSQTSTVPTKRKSGVQEEIPMEQRLENLTLSKSEGKVPRVDNVAQLLVQGLHSKDKNILRTALCRKDETIIRNTVKRLPITVFDQLIAELTSLLEGKTILSHFGALWLKHLVQVHAGVLISNPNLVDMFSGASATIRSRIDTQPSINRLRGKLELLLPQVSASNDVESNVDDDALLVFNDKDSSDSEPEEDDIPIEIPSDSEPEVWEDEQENGEGMELGNHVDSSDSDSVIMVDDGLDDSD